MSDNDNNEYDFSEGVIASINDALCMFEMGQLTREELPRELLVTALRALYRDANECACQFITDEGDDQ